MKPNSIDYRFPLTENFKSVIWKCEAVFENVQHTRSDIACTELHNDSEVIVNNLKRKCSFDPVIILRFTQKGILKF
jgi:hypothetical protein